MLERRAASRKLVGIVGFVCIWVIGCPTGEVPDPNRPPVVAGINVEPDPGGNDGTVAGGTPLLRDATVFAVAGETTEIVLSTTRAGEAFLFEIVEAPDRGRLGPVIPGPDAGSATVAFEAPADFIGVLTLDYRAKSSAGVSDTARITLHIGPLVEFDFSPRSGAAPLTVVADVRSLPAELQLQDVQLRWDWDGSLDEGPMFSHGRRARTFSKPGRYAVGLSLIAAGIATPIAAQPVDSGGDAGGSGKSALTQKGNGNGNGKGTVVVNPTVRGEVLDESGNPLRRVTVLSNDGRSTETDGRGRYELTIPLDWSGTVAPVVEGATFDPPSRAYTGLDTDQDNQNFNQQAVILSALSISGRVADESGQPIPGATLVSSDGDTVATDQNGGYIYEVSDGWSGSVSASADGWVFEPPARNYADLDQHQTQQDYTGRAAVRNFAVDPPDAFAAAGGAGGPFTPASKSYVLTNTGDLALSWSAQSNAGWVQVNPASGSLAAGGSVNVVASLAADELPMGDYTAVLTFRDTSAGGKALTRGVTLSASAPGGLDVSPMTGFQSGGPQGGPFSPTSKVYQLSNPGDGQIEWTLATPSWLKATPAGGTLAAGGSVNVTVTVINAGGLSPGAYAGSIDVVNETNGMGGAELPAGLTVTAPGNMAVSPADGLSSSGFAGGPFSPNSKSYTLTNSGGQAFSWSAQGTANWISVSPAGGTLAAGGSVTVNVTIDSDANGLAAGNHLAAVSFTNLTDGSGSTARSVTLTVQQPASMTVTPNTTFASSGPEGGSLFLPGSASYTLRNEGAQTLAWTATDNRNWLRVNPAGGTLPAGGTAVVTVSLDTAAAAGLPAGVHTGTATFTNSTNGVGNTTRQAQLNVLELGTLAVTPATHFSSSGPRGGPFSPGSTSYTLTNSGDLSLNWSASGSKNWLTVSPSSGALSPGASVTVSVSIDGDANALAAGVHSATVTLTNTSNGRGNATRNVTLTVVDAAALAVSPADGLSSSGSPGGPFTPSSKSYTLTNSGDVPLSWTAADNASWVSVSPTGGTLSGGASATVTVSLNANANGLAADDYAATVTFTNTTNGAGNTTRPVNLSVLAPGSLAVTPGGGFTSSGAEGGPFSPGSKSYTLANSGDSPLNWTAAKTKNWVTLSQTSGTLAAGASTTVTVTLNANADGLSTGAHSDTVTFSNTTNGLGSTTRGVSLTVNDASDCETGAAAWQNFAIAAQTGVFTAEFDATPNGSNIDGLTVMSQGAGSAYSDFAITIRFNTSGKIDARDGDSYRADTAVSYSGGTSYHFRVVASVTSRSYNVYVTPQGGSEVQLANQFAFRTQQAHNTQIDYWGLNASIGAHDVCNFSVSSGGTFPGVLTVTPSGALNASGDAGGPFNPNSASYTLTNSGGQALSWSASRTQNWVTLSAGSGNLAAGASTTLVVSLNANANQLSDGVYADTVTISNTTNGSGNTTRAVNLVVGTPPVQMADSITQYGITWTFDQEYPVGQFVTGDWWVTPLTPGGNVTVVAVDPPTQYINVQVAWNNGNPTFANHWVHGSVLNPRIGGQGYDSRAAAFNTSDKVTYPVTMGVNSSLLSSISWTDSVAAHSDVVGDSSPYKAGRSYTRTIAVLTVLSGDPGATAFRPGYCDPDKTIYHTSAINHSLLPSLTPQSGSFFRNIPGHEHESRCKQYARAFQRPYIFHNSDWHGRQIHPTDTMPDYHEQVFDLYSDAAVVLLCNYPDRDDLLIPYLQMGIDAFHATELAIAQDRVADSAIGKWPVLFAGLMLNDTGMQNTAYTGYRSDRMTYYRNQAQSSNNSSVVPSNTFWVYHAGVATGSPQVGWRQDPGNPEHEHTHPSEWGHFDYSGKNGHTREVYRRINSHTWPGVALAARLMNADGQWGDPAFFQYVDRWMTENAAAIEQAVGPLACPALGSCSSQFVKNMWNVHR